MSAITRKQAIGLIALMLIGGAAFTTHNLAGERTPAYLVEQGELHQSVVASGRVRTPRRIELATQIAGRVTAVLASEGMVVEAGQLLVQLDATELQAAHDQARATLTQSQARQRQLGDLSRPLAEQARRQAEANWQQAKKQQERSRELVERGFYSPAQLDEANRALAVAESQLRSGEVQLASNQPDGAEARVTQSAVEQSRAALALAEAKLSYARLSSPVAGRILSRHIEPGDTAQPGKVLLLIAPLGDSQVTTQIDEKNIALLALGQSATISADAYPQVRFKATLSYIAPAVDAQRGSVEVRLLVPEPPAFLKHEMTVSIDIETGKKARAMQIPADSLRDAASLAPWVMVLRDGRAQRQAVKLGLRGSGRVEIIEGLALDEAVLPASLAVPEGRRLRAVLDTRQSQ